MADIDYLNNAAERIKLAITAPQTEHEVPAMVLAQIATAEATLALAREQRTANLIAVAQMEGGPYKAINRWLIPRYGDDGYTVGTAAAIDTVEDQIREALGLS